MTFAQTVAAVLSPGQFALRKNGKLAVFWVHVLPPPPLNTGQLTGRRMLSWCGDLVGCQRRCAKLR